MSVTEPRALTAALQAPAFVTRGGAAAMRAANRHVERWAPEEGASRFRPLRNLGFVDRLVTPWLESAQRSTSLRMFSQVAASPVPERAAPSQPSWVFPRPWFQDELDWMAAARQQPAPTMLTTRGTYVPQASAMPTSLHEYVAPSLSLARPDVAMLGDAYSPLVPFAATQAAHVMARAVAPIGAGALSPGLRSVLATMLERATRTEDIPTRTSQYAPVLVTPPAPRGHVAEDDDASLIADRYAEQHDRIAELQRMARLAAERELASRSAQVAAPITDARIAEVRAAEARAVEQRQAELQRRLGDAAARRQTDSDGAAAAAERQRIEERIAQRLAAMRQQEAVRLHEQSRDAAARDARNAALASSAPTPAAEQPRAESRVVAEIAVAVASLPPELAAMVTANIGQHPERAVQAIGELSDALRSVELIARTTAAGGAIEATRGPRLVMPAGLGGLVATVERTTDRGEHATSAAPAQRMPALPFSRAAAATTALGATTSATPAALGHVAWSDRWLARFAGARPQSLEVLAMAASPETRMQVLASAAPHAVFVAPMFEDRSNAAQPSGELGFDIGFGGRGARGVDEPLPTLRGGPAPAQPVLRFDDNAETPDDMLAAIAMAATRSRASAALGAAVTSAPPPSLPTVDPERYQPRDTLADLVAHAAPSAPGAGLAAALASSPFASALRHVMTLGSAPTFDVRALFGAGLSATYLAGMIEPAASEIAIDAPLSWQPTTRAVSELDLPLVAPRGAELDEDGASPLTTLRSALLAFDVETTAGASAPQVTATPLARTMVDSLALPMLADTMLRDSSADYRVNFAAPGMIAERAQAWSVAQERSSADLAFDFVPPELVLAARVYGLGPAEAAQAARLAVAGAGQLTAMAGAVDRTFVQAMAIEGERRAMQSRSLGAYPLAADAHGGVHTAASATDGEPHAFAPTAASFGVQRRAPRGAFLWPAATTAALGLSAAGPDGEQSISVAALELLAAQAVAELGTYAALGERTSVDAGVAGGAEPADADVVATASALVPATRREKFQALYLALGQSSAGRSASPAARAARALALAGRGEESVSARERATVAWDVLPVVYGIADAPSDEQLSTGEAAARTMRRRDELRALDPVLVDSRPGLGGLSARAGEALGSYVAPPAAPASSSSSSREVGAVLRAPTAAPELVRTGGGRHGGGEVEIPSWFEAAARKMFEDHTASSSVADGISLAELTLVATAPSQQIAASTRVAGSTPAVATNPAAVDSAAPAQVDIEKLANDVYREVLVLMDIARSRNGEPYL